MFISESAISVMYMDSKNKDKGLIQLCEPETRHQICSFPGIRLHVKVRNNQITTECDYKSSAVEDTVLIKQSEVGSRWRRFFLP